MKVEVFQMTMLTRMPSVSLVDNFGLWLTAGRVRADLMSSNLLLLRGHLLLIGFRSHSQPLIILDDEVFREVSY